jgi:hypothetical protein
MSNRKLRVLNVAVRTVKFEENNDDVSLVEIVFSRKLTALEVSGVEAVLVGQIK